MRGFSGRHDGKWRVGRWRGGLVAVSVLAVGAMVVGSGARSTLAAASDASPADGGTDSYIVRFVTGSDAGREAADLAGAGIDVDATFHDVFPGAVVQASPKEAAALRRDPAVLSLASDQVLELNDPTPSVSSIQAVQTGPTWGLDRSDQRNLPLSGTYGYDYTGTGVDVYVLDTGIRSDHVEFGGRVLPGFSAVPDGNGWQDCNGHGTHVAGTIGSATYGIAKSVRLIPVRVMNCDGTGSTSGIITGLNWIIAGHLPGVPAVLNMSIGGNADPTLDAAVQAAIEDGITVVAAAGNSTKDACGYSPARVSGVITVAATDHADSAAYFSNWGRCVDLFAPGDDITSTWNTSSTATNRMSGTSMASPHVAGAVALLLQQQPGLSPAQVAAQLVAAATPELVAYGRTSPNLLLYEPTHLLAPPPPNDNFAAASTFSLAQAGSLSGTSMSATEETGEPNHAGLVGGRSAWWAFTAPADGTVTLSTHGSPFDTVLAVYTGASVAALTPVASNDDHAPDSWSQLSFAAVAGTTYRIAVDGHEGLSGPITIQSTWQPIDYLPLAPARLADTRPGMSTIDGGFAGTGTVAGGSILELQVTGRAGVPVDAAAVVLNVTATEATGSGFVTVFPCAAPRPNGSSLNYLAGSTVANAVIARVGAGGRVCLFTLTDVHFVIDANGYFPASSAFTSLVPARLMDSRPGAATTDSRWAGNGFLIGGSVTQLHVTDRGGVPGTAAAVVLNVTVTEPSGSGFVTVFPCGASVPNGSSLNYATGSTVANAVIAKVGTGGNVCLFTSSGTHLIVDINGYFPPGSSFTSLVPARLLETRAGLSTIDGRYNAIGRRPAGSTVELTVTGRADVAKSASAVVLNVTVTEAARAGYVTVYPCGSTRPNAANLNFAAAATTPNAVVAKVGDGGTVCVFTSADAHLVVDIIGYFAAGA